MGACCGRNLINFGRPGARNQCRGMQSGMVQFLQLIPFHIRKYVSMFAQNMLEDICRTPTWAVEIPGRTKVLQDWSEQSVPVTVGGTQS